MSKFKILLNIKGIDLLHICQLIIFTPHLTTGFANSLMDSGKSGSQSLQQECLVKW